MAPRIYIKGARAPTGETLAAKAMLQGRGWTVTTD